MAKLDVHALKSDEVSHVKSVQKQAIFVFSTYTHKYGTLADLSLYIFDSPREPIQSRFITAGAIDLKLCTCVPLGEMTTNKISVQSDSWPNSEATKLSHLCGHAVSNGDVIKQQICEGFMNMAPGLLAFDAKEIEMMNMSS
jgi:hypothetical protein